MDLQYAEKVKSGLIIGTGLLDQLALLKGEEHAGGQKVLIWYLEGLLQEVRIAENVLGKGHYRDLERGIMEVVGRLQMSQFEEALRSFSAAISSATTSCQASMNFLVEQRMI